MNENPPSSGKYRQLALFSFIVAEVVVTPSVLGGILYWVLRGKPSQTVWAGVGALVGLAIAFYRIHRLNRKWSRET